MERIRLQIYQITVFLSLISIVFALISPEKQRELFYSAVYISIIGFFFERNNIRFKNFSIAYPILLVGLLNLIWYFFYEYKIQGIITHCSYLHSSKKLILASFLVFYIEKFKFYIPFKNFKKYFFIATAIGFILATIYALQQHLQGIVRVEMAINRATISSYIYSVLSFSFIYSLYILKNQKYQILLISVILISWNIILYTGTRAAIGLYLLLIIIIMFFYFKKVRIESIFFFLIFIIGITFNNKTIILLKITETKNAVEKYKNGQDNTSLGSRFSMWIIGIKNGISHPFGQSTKSRETWSRQYINNRHLYLTSSLIYISIHFHNEFIEKYSLQGIPGILVLSFFFISTICRALKNKNLLLFGIVFFLFLYGLTDVLLLSSETILFFMTIFALSTLLENNMPKLVND